MQDRACSLQVDKLLIHTACSRMSGNTMSFAPLLTDRYSAILTGQGATRTARSTTIRHRRTAITAVQYTSSVSGQRLRHPALLGLMVVVELSHLLRRSVHRRGSTRAFVRLRAAGSTVRRCDLARLAEPSEILAQRTEPHRGPSLIDTVGLFEVSWKGDTVTDRHRDAPRARSHSISGSACHDFGTGVHFTDVTFEEFAGSEVSG